MPEYTISKNLFREMEKEGVWELEIKPPPIKDDRWKARLNYRTNKGEIKGSTPWTTVIADSRKEAEEIALVEFTAWMGVINIVAPQRDVVVPAELLEWAVKSLRYKSGASDFEKAEQLRALLNSGGEKKYKG